MDFIKLYEERAKAFSDEAARLESRYNRNSVIRLLLFLGGMAVFAYLFNYGWLWPALFLLAFLASFGVFVRWHLRIKAAQIHQEALAQVNLNEVAACLNDLSAFNPGTGFTDPAHPFALDLDLFGPFSFFQFANRTSTAIGQRKLAEYLQWGASIPEIKSRQEAVKELGEKLDWRQHFQAFGMATEDQLSHLQALQKWLTEEPFLFPKKWVPVAMYLAPIWFVAMMLITIWYLPWQAGFLAIIPQALILRKFLQQINLTHQHTSHAEKILAYYAQLIRHIEGEQFVTPKLQELLQLLQVETGTASAAVGRLSYIISQLNVRMNPFVVFFNLIGLWDLHWVWRLEKWKALQKDHLEDWFKALEEMEALLSLATVHFNQPDWAFPEVQDEPQLIAKDLGHPLIPAAKRVNNDLAMPTEAHTKLITGSNMAGKSTFLRSVGLNIALAMAGSAVCARSLRLPPIQVYTSMRTQDALHESTSSFYAELKRLKVIIEAVDAGKVGNPGGRQPFFLLDEILKGTNSNDRHTGSKALINQLIKSKGSGLIATHDLELGAMEAQYGGAIENLCMEVEVKGDELVFDYKIKKGVSKSFNATHLMRNMGIRIEE